MGWFNATIGIHAASKPVDGNALLLQLAKGIQRHLEVDGVALAFQTRTAAADAPGHDAAPSLNDAAGYDTVETWEGWID